ncbi:MAG: cation:proton antiporter [Christensenellales bacterium]
MDYTFLLVLAVILFSTKLLGIAMKKLGLPQVLGYLLAGIILGATGLVKRSTELTIFATIGVNLIMFSAGLETNLKEIKRNGAASVLITSLGVIVPMVVGFGVSWIIPGLEMKERWFFGVILTATSVGITVACLKELGVLHGKVGASIITAAVLDDIIGIVILAFFTAEAKDEHLGVKIIKAFGGDMSNLAGVAVLLNVVLFFAMGIGLGLLVHYAFKLLSKRFPHTRRLSAFGLVLCFLYAGAAEKFFGVAAITGSFLAGMMLSNMQETEYVERRIDISAYMLFSPIFFANIGISLDYASLVDNINARLVLFSLAFVICGMLAKVIGCGAGAAAFKYKPNQSLKVGVGMMVRGEVCLIVAQTGQRAGIIDSQYFPAIILLIVASSIATPLILKVLFKKYPNEPLDENKIGAIDTVVKVDAAMSEVRDFLGGMEVKKIEVKPHTQREAMRSENKAGESPTGADDTQNKETK